MNATPWPEIAVKSVCESVIDCVNKTAPVVDYETPYKMIRTTNVKNGVVNIDSVRYVEKDVFIKWTRRAVPQVGDVILTREAPLGDVGMLTQAGEKIFLGQRLMQYRANPENLDNYFLLYALQESHMQSQLKAAGSGSTVEHVRVGDAENLKIRLPDLHIQKEISSILKAYDNLIVNNNRRIAILEEMAQSLYREWFVKFRFPGHENTKFIDSPLGKIPEGWGIVSLGDVIDIKKGKNITKKTIVEGDVPVVAGGLTPAYYHNQANTRHPVITVSASGANAGFVNLYEQDIWASDCSFIDANTSDFVYYYYLLFKYHQLDITRLQRGSAQPHVYPKDLMRLEAINVPNYVLVGFNDEIAVLFRLIKSLSKKNANLKKQRDFLLPKLISGSINIHNEKWVE